MLEYVFFDTGLRERFAAFLGERGVSVEFNDADGFIALVPEDIDDELCDALDELYDQLLDENADMLENAEGSMEKQAAGVRVLLSDGTPCMVRLMPELMGRMLNSISMEELRDLVQDIALQVEGPDDLPVAPEMKERLLNSITMEDLRGLVQEIALQAADPDDLPVCHTRERKTGG